MIEIKDKKLIETLNFLNQKTDNFVPEIVVVLGSGLSVFSDGLDGIKIPYKDIPNFGTSNVQGHKGELLFCRINNKNVAIMQGRFHFYEGNSAQTSTYPIKVFKLMGAKTIILTNAAGALNPKLNPGDILLIKDHINFMGTNPLIGENDEALGERFPDMTNIYCKNLRELIKKIAKEEKIKLKEGVYLATTGPSYETPAEVKLYRKYGADVVGMSTVFEAIVSNYLKMNTIGISMVTNYASGVKKNLTLTHQEVLEEGKKAGVKISYLVKKIIEKL